MKQLYISCILLSLILVVGFIHKGLSEKEVGEIIKKEVGFFSEQTIKKLLVSILFLTSLIPIVNIYTAYYGLMFAIRGFNFKKD